MGSLVNHQAVSAARADEQDHHRQAVPDRAADDRRVQPFATIVDRVERSEERVSPFAGWASGRHAHWAGLSVTALMALIRAVAAIVSANWR